MSRRRASSKATDLQEAARQLCHAAIDARCGDNTTVLLVRLTPSQTEPAAGDGRASAAPAQKS